ncbi:MAG TPA: hypothetical protein VHH72_02215 [Solirubrobacterales bacterium]|jgi:hypothetical protein|nr:hypothetical protein [Solirubrobacterales bacterium]
MRTKLTALTVLCATAALGASLAHAGPVTIALYTFQSQGDVLAFVKQAGAKCTKKWSQNMAMRINVGPGTNSCAFRSSVVGDSTDPGSDMEISATAQSSAPRQLQKKAYVGVGARVSENAGYELRVRPVARTWQLFRDPKGSAGPSLFRSGKGKFIRMGAKPNALLLRAFDHGTTSTQLIATVNGKAVVTATDGAADQPDGRRSTVAAGAKGTGPGDGIAGTFDNVAIKVPNPF